MVDVRVRLGHGLFTWSMNEPIAIRRGALADLASIRACVAEAYGPYVSIIGKEPAAMRTDFTPYLERGQVLVATLDGELVGLAILVDEQDYVELRSMAVLPALQGRGIGSRLLAEAQSRARSLGRATIRLYTNAHLPRLVSMYERMGFIERERKHDGGYDRVFMTKEI